MLAISSFRDHLQPHRHILDLHGIYDHIKLVTGQSTEHELMPQPFTNLLLFLKIFQKDRRLESNLFIELSESFSRDRHFLFSIVELVQWGKKELLVDFIVAVIGAFNEFVWGGKLVF